MIKRLQDRLETARNNDNGFTLIELLIVIVVLGILAGIVVLGLGTFRADSQLAACRADLKQVQTAVDAFVARPTNAGGALPTGVGAAWSADPQTLVGSGLLRTPPPASSGTYTIAATGVTSSVC